LRIRHPEGASGAKRGVTDVLGQLLAWTAAGAPAAVATVVDVRLSAPRPPGTRMAVGPEGQVVGAVTGGCVEGAVVLAAEEVLAGGAPRLLHFGIADEEAWGVGLPCGGEVDVWVERFTAGPLASYAACVRDGERAALVTAVGGDVPRLGAHLLVRADGTVEGGLAEPWLDAAAVRCAERRWWNEHSGTEEADGAQLFVAVAAPRPRLLIFGAIDFAAQLCALARGAGWRPYVIDPRARFATEERFPDAERVLAQWPQAAVEQLGGIDRATSIAVLTHDPKLDDAALLLALRSDASYVGAMGSRRTQERRLTRLRALGFDDDELERLSAPIGLDIGALTAEETALSIMAEIVAQRRGHEGGRLRNAAGRIHGAAR